MVEKKPNDALRKLQQAEDAKKGRAEYDAAAKALDANTARLRALRLAKEEAEAKSAPAPAAKRKPAAKKAKAATGNLSEWLKDRQGSGHNN